MAIFGQWPWTNFHEMNLDWVIKTVKEGIQNVQGVVEDYFAAHVDNTLTVSGDAADAATVGSRLTTINGSLTSLGNRVTTLENTAVHYYNFKKQGHDVNIIPNPLMTDRTTTDALLADISNNYQYVILFEGFPAENVCIDPDDSDNLLFSSTLYDVVFDTTQPKGSFTTRTDYLVKDVIEIQMNAGMTSGTYTTGDYTTLDSKLSDDIVDNIIAVSDNGTRFVNPIAYKKNTTPGYWDVTFYSSTPGHTITLRCLDDDSVTIMTAP